MIFLPVNAVGEIGLLKEPDRYPHELPLNAWSDGINVRMRDGIVEKFLGHQQVFGTPGAAPYFTMPINIGGVYSWLLAGLAKVYQWDGSAHNNITRQSAGVDVDYSATVGKNWTGGRLGSIAILNNGVDVPQFWTGTGVCQDLTNWNPDHVCESMRVFRRFLVAMNVTKNGTSFAQMVKWSHPAASGAVPVSWDETDETKDAGEYEILDSDGAVVDGASMREHFVIYKEDSAHLMQYVGGIDIFRFVPLFDSFGILSKRCAGEFARGRHAVFAQGDLITHNGVTWESIVDSRMRKWIFNQIDGSNYGRSFVAMNPAYQEVWFCFPVSGEELPSLAVVWNWKYNTLSVRELDAAHISAGTVSALESSDLWDNDSSTWDSDPSIWDEGVVNPAGKRLLIADAAGNKLHWGDSTNQFDGSNMLAYIQRTGLPLPVQQLIPDTAHKKFITELWPRILGTDGATLQISVGSQQKVGGPITWLPARDFIIGTSEFIDFRISAPLFALKVSSNTDIDWKFLGYEVRYRQVTRFHG